jgi:hypothetical protein
MKIVCRFEAHECGGVVVELEAYQPAGTNAEGIAPEFGPDFLF